jgi:hypothetical protein
MFPIFNHQKYPLTVRAIAQSTPTQQYAASPYLTSDNIELTAPMLFTTLLLQPSTDECGS